MTPAQLRAWIEARGLTLAQAAQALACSRQLVVKMLAGERAITARTVRMIELLNSNEERK